MMGKAMICIIFLLGLVFCLDFGTRPTREWEKEDIVVSKLDPAMVGIVCGYKYNGRTGDWMYVVRWRFGGGNVQGIIGKARSHRPFVGSVHYGYELQRKDV